MTLLADIEIALSGRTITLLACVLGAYLVGLFLISLYAKSKIRDEADYLVAGRRLPLFFTWGTLLATWFGAASMAGAAQAAREEGIIGNILDPFACSATLILAGLFFAKPLWRMKLLTIADFYRRRYGTRSEILSSSIQVPSYFGWIAAQYVALASVQHAYFGIPEKYGILIAAGITLTYTMIGGMWSVTLTDTVQMVVALFGLVVLGATTFGTYGGGSVLEGIDKMLAGTDPAHLTLLPEATSLAVLAWVGTWATGLFGNIPGQDLQQRVFSAKSEKVAAQACLLAGVFYLLFGMIPISLGLLSNQTDPGDIQGKILPLLAGKYLSPTMALVFIVAFVSIVVSTATSAVLAPATILAHNLLGHLSILQQRHLLLDRLCVLIVAAGGVALAYTGQSIMDLLDVSLSIALVGLFVPLVAGLYLKPRGELPALLSMGLGFGFWLVRYVVESTVVVMPDEVAETMQYNQYVASVFSPEQYGQALSLTASAAATVPADLWGLGASVVGYCVGQHINRRRGIEHDPTDPEAETAR